MNSRAFRFFLATFVAVIAAACWAAAHEPAYNTAVRVRTVLQTAHTQSGQALEYPKRHAQVTILEVEIPPGAQTGWHTHPFPGFAYVESGRLTVQTRHTSHTFAAGEGFAETVSTPHTGRNLGRVSVKLIVIFTGMRGTPIVQKIPPQ